MHEVSLVRSLIDTARREMVRAGAAGRVTRLKLTIGRLSCASPEALRFAFEALAPGTVLEGAALDIETARARCLCPACGAQTEIDDVFSACPACGATDVSIDGGRELSLDFLEVDDALEPENGHENRRCERDPQGQ